MNYEELEWYLWSKGLADDESEVFYYMNLLNHGYTMKQILKRENELGGHVTLKEMTQ